MSAFRNCSGLTGELNIPNSVTEIGMSAFKNCSGLNKVTIPNSVTKIYSEAFCGCNGLTEIIIPESIVSIDGSAFQNCRMLTTLYFNAINCDYCGSLFYSAFPKELKTIIIGDKVTKIPQATFSNCSKLTEVTIPNSVTSIGECAFFNCSSLKIITIGNSVKSIGESAFKDCSNLTSFTIPASVASIGKDAFHSLNLVSIRCEAENPPESQGFGISNQPTLYVRKQSLDLYKQTWPWSTSFEEILPYDDSEDPETPEEDPDLGNEPDDNDPTQPEPPGEGEDDPGEGEDDAAIDDVNGDSETGVSVEGSSIVAPEGSLIYDLMGRRVNPTSLSTGIYIVRTPAGKAVKIKL